MANTFQSGTLYVDSTGQVFTGAIKISYVVFRANAANDELILRDGTAGTAPIKLSIQIDTAKRTQTFDFSRNPIVFQTGVYCSAVTASAVATLQTTTQGAT